MAHYLVLTQQVAASTSQEPPVTEEATTTAMDATTTAVDAPQAEPAHMPCDQQLCNLPQESIAAEAQGLQLTSSGLTVNMLIAGCVHADLYLAAKWERLQYIHLERTFTMAVDQQDLCNSIGCKCKPSCPSLLTLPFSLFPSYPLILVIPILLQPQRAEGD